MNVLCVLSCYLCVKATSDTFIITHFFFHPLLCIQIYSGPVGQMLNVTSRTVSGMVLPVNVFVFRPKPSDLDPLPQVCAIACMHDTTLISYVAQLVPLLHSYFDLFLLFFFLI